MQLSRKHAALAGLVAAGALLTGTLTSLAANHSAALTALHLGSASMKAQTTYLAYYDGHKDSYLNTDVSDKAQASAWHINYAPLLAKALKSTSPEYFVSGRAAAGQLAVFGSEPPDPAYSPLWQEYIVTWKAGVKPVLLIKDDQIKDLAKQGKLTNKPTTVVLNAPILKVNTH